MEYTIPEYTIEHLSVDLLEKDAEKYLEVLVYLEKNVSIDEIKVKLNEKPYHSWYGNHLFALTKLVGSLNDDSKSEICSPDDFLGAGLTDGIPEDLGITILNKIVSLGVDLKDTDYYDDTIVDIVNKTNYLSYRDKNNEKFKQKVREYYSS
tara:strand:- start:186 stop:638 length:453 start_codon:yes stop_codon:yes gene_type:complete